MKIKKMYQGTVPENKILNMQSDSQTDVYSCDYINKLNTYSTEEQVIGTWFDKPLYRRVFQTSEALVADTILTITTGLSDIDLMWIDTGNCFMYMNTIGGMKRNVYTIPFHYTPQFQNDYITVQVSASDIQILAHDKWSSNWTKVITVNYTKTTD